MTTTITPASACQQLIDAAYVLQRKAADLTRLLVLARDPADLDPDLPRWISHHLGSTLSAVVEAAEQLLEAGPLPPAQPALDLTAMADKTSTGSLR